jgi:hypothetical protein
MGMPHAQIPSMLAKGSTGAFATSRAAHASFDCLQCCLAPSILSSKLEGDLAWVQRWWVLLMVVGQCLSWVGVGVDLGQDDIRGGA